MIPQRDTIAKKIDQRRPPIPLPISSKPDSPPQKESTLLQREHPLLQRENLLLQREPPLLQREIRLLRGSKLRNPLLLFLILLPLLPLLPLCCRFSLN